MATKPPVTTAAGVDDRDPDFEFALKALLGAYQPILEQELARSKDPAVGCNAASFSGLARHFLHGPCQGEPP